MLRTPQEIVAWTFVGLCFGAAFYLTHIYWMRAVGVPAWFVLSALETLFTA